MDAMQMAERCVHQWDNYDKIRHIEVGGGAEPSGVTMARSLLKTKAMVQTLEADIQHAKRRLEKVTSSVRDERTHVSHMDYATGVLHGLEAALALLKATREG